MILRYLIRMKKRNHEISAEMWQTVPGISDTTLEGLVCELAMERSKLRLVQKNAVSLREEFLQERAEYYSEILKRPKTNIINNIKNAEITRRLYKKITVAAQRYEPNTSGSHSGPDEWHHKSCHKCKGYAKTHFGC